MKTARELRDERLEGLVAQARRAYENHELIDRGDRWWLMAQRYEDGKLQSAYLTDVYCDHFGGIFVGGDISTMCFSCFGDSGSMEARLAWMGRCTDLDYYVAQKASIGMTGKGERLVWDWDSELAAMDIREHVATLVEEGYELTEDEKELWEDFASEAEGGEECLEVLEYRMYRDLSYDELEGLGNFGRILSSRVIYAWAALEKLCDLLDIPRRGK
jgi:hypothetical protein